MKSIQLFYGGYNLCVERAYIESFKWLWRMWTFRPRIWANFMLQCLHGKVSTFFTSSGAAKKTNTFKCLARQKYIHAFSHTVRILMVWLTSAYKIHYIHKLTEQLGPKFMMVTSSISPTNALKRHLYIFCMIWSGITDK